MLDRLRELPWIPLTAVQCVVATLWSMACITVALGVRLVTGNTRLALGMARWPWAPGMMLLGGWTYEVEGLENVDWSRPHFVASNHQSFLDIILLFRALPVNLHFVVKEELSKVPFLAWYIRAMGMIFIDRRNRKRARESVQETGELVAAGKTVLLFPEGTRSRDGEVKRLKSGVLAAAAASSVPVVPVAVDGCREGFPPEKIRIRPAHLKVAVGEPIPTGGYSVDDRRELADEVRESIVGLLDGLREE